MIVFYILYTSYPQTIANTAGNYRSAATYVISEQGFEIYSSTVKKNQSCRKASCQNNQSPESESLYKSDGKICQKCYFQGVSRLLVWDF